MRTEAGAFPLNVKSWFKLGDGDWCFYAFWPTAGMGATDYKEGVVFCRHNGVGVVGFSDGDRELRKEKTMNPAVLPAVQPSPVSLRNSGYWDLLQQAGGL